MQEQLEIRQRMSMVRTRGLANATELAERVERLSDWREHVRAHPWPIALAAGALAFWIVPARRVPRHAPAYTPSMGASESRAAAAASSSETPTEREAKMATFSGIGGAAMGFVGSLIGNAVRSYVSEQVQSLINPRGNHDAPQQRQAPFSRF